MKARNAPETSRMATAGRSPLLVGPRPPTEPRVLPKSVPPTLEHVQIYFHTANVPL